MARSTEKKPAELKSEEKAGRKRVTVYLPPEQWRALKVQAARTDREMSEIVSEALKKIGVGG